MTVRVQIALLSYLATNAAQHSMIWVSAGELHSPEGVNRLGAFLGAMGQSQLDMSGKEAELDPGDWLCQVPKDRLTTHHFGQRIAEVTERYVANSLVAADYVADSSFIRYIICYLTQFQSDYFKSSSPSSLILGLNRISD